VVVIDHAEAAVRPPADRRGRGAQDPQAGRGAAGSADWVRRARIIALSWDGLRVPAIAQALGCSQKAVRYRLARFTADGLDGLGDRPGAGRKPRISESQRSQLLAPGGRPAAGPAGPRRHR
jgi:Homeodomain-like domain